MRASWSVATVAACALVLAACSKQVDNNAVAPGRPGTGNGIEVVKPVAPDGATRPSGGDAVPGITGSGTSDAAGSSQAAQPGVGLDGGLGSNTAMGASTAASGGAVPAGSANTSPGSAVGTRP